MITPTLARQIAAPRVNELRHLAAPAPRRRQAMRDWLTTASACGCDSLESCALFVAEPQPLQIEGMG
jgi:hypothetical protein